jgi:hypothetical protein
MYHNKILMHSDGPEVLFGIEKKNNIICIQETVNVTSAE